MAARRGVRRYITGTAQQIGVEIPRAQAGGSGGLLILLVGAYLLLAFVTGRLGWLTGAISDTFSTYRTYSSSAPAAPPAGPAGARPNLPRPRTPLPVPA